MTKSGSHQRADDVAHVLYLSRNDVEAADLSMARIIELVQDALIEKAHGRTQMPAEHWLVGDGDRWFGGMSSLVPKTGCAAMKWQSGSTENAGRGLPYITGMLMLNSLEQGLVSVVMDSTWITQQRTAAASAVAVAHLAPAGARSYAMLGTGVQGRSHFDALRRVLPALEEVVIYDIDTAAAAAFAMLVAQNGYRPTVVNSPRAALDSTDIVVTGGPIAADATRAIAPEWLRPGLTAVAIDYDCYWRADTLDAVDLLVTDDLTQIDHIKTFGYFDRCRIPEIELGQVVAGLKLGRRHPGETIVVLNMGVAVEDVVTAKAVYEHATSRSLGTLLPR